MKDLSEADLYDEKSALAGLTLTKRMPKMSPKGWAPIDQYQYPPQECSIRLRDEIYKLDGQKFGDVVAADPLARTIDIKKLVRLDAIHPASVFAHAYYGTKEQSKSILRLADWIVANGIDAHGDYRAARDLLLRNPPRFSDGCSIMASAGETVAELACRLGLALDHSVLPIQGPPGAGKTFTGARMICELIRNGRKVGITAVGHKIIRKLLDDVVQAARDSGVPSVACAHKTDGDGVAEGQGVREISTNDEALHELQSGAVNVLGGTPWLWSRADFAKSVDVLFVDEAGQMSLANVLTCASRPESSSVGRSAAIGATAERQPSGRFGYFGSCASAQWPDDDRKRPRSLFCRKLTVFTLPFAGSRPRCSTKGGWSLSTGLSANRSKRQPRFSGLVCGFFLSSTKATRAIRWRKLNAWRALSNP